MEKKLKMALIIVMSLILVGTVVIFAYVYFTQDRIDKTNTNSTVNTNAVTNSNANTNQAVNTNTGNLNTNSGTANTNSSPTSDVNASAETLLKPIARNFAERFGSYSSDSNFENITKLEIYMSASLKKWAENYVKEQRDLTSVDDPYFGITTRALSITTDIVNEEGGKAEFTISTQRNQTKLDEESEIVYQDIRLKFIKEEGEWKVNEANWL